MEIMIINTHGDPLSLVDILFSPYSGHSTTMWIWKDGLYIYSKIKVMIYVG